MTEVIDHIKICSAPEFNRAIKEMVMENAFHVSFIPNREPVFEHFIDMSEYARNGILSSNFADIASEIVNEYRDIREKGMYLPVVVEGPIYVFDVVKQLSIMKIPTFFITDFDIKNNNFHHCWSLATEVILMTPNPYYSYEPSTGDEEYNIDTSQLCLFVMPQAVSAIAMAKTTAMVFSVYDYMSDKFMMNGTIVRFTYKTRRLFDDGQEDDYPNNSHA